MPLSNSHLERCFSQLKITKSNRRSCLKQDQLDNLLRIRIEGPPLKEWNSERAVQLWWEDKSYRVNRSDVQATRSSRTSSTASESNEEFSWMFDDWETWLESDPDSDSD